MNVNDFCKEHNLTLDQFYGKEVIEGHLYLSSLTELPEGFNPIVSCNLDLYSLKELPKGFNPIVGGDLDLNSITTLPEGFNPIVGCNLYLSSLKELPKGFNPIVGGYLNLYSITTLPNNFKPKCKTIQYNQLNSSKELNTNYIIFNNYIKTDNLYKIIEENGNQYKVQELTSDKIFYIITDDINYGQSDYLVEALINLKNKY